MCKVKLLFMMCILLTHPFISYCEENELEIRLLEIASSSIISDSPLDSPGEYGDIPPSPNQFHAYISGRTLSVTSEATSDTQIRVVNRQTNQTIVNRQFSSFDSEQLPSGLYSIELQCGNLLLVGQFQAE